MQVSLLANSIWLDEELVGFRHLIVGLIDEQVRVAQVVPDNLPVDDAIPFGDRVSWEESGWGWLRRRRIAGLADELEKLEPDVIHALHHHLWEGTLELALDLEAAVVLQVTGEEEVQRALKLLPKLDPARVAFAVTTQPLATQLSERLPDSFMVRTIRPGVRIPTAEPDDKPTAHEPPLCALICGQTRHDTYYESLFVAIQKLIVDHPEVQFFLDAPTEADNALWQSARKLNILSNVSMVPHRLGHRELELGADVMIHPQPLHRSRTLTLQAMALGLPVIAHSDPCLDYLIDDQTAWLTDKADASRWEEMLRHLIIAPDSGEALGSRAREWVRENHLVSQHVADTIDLYRTLTGETIKFPG